MIEIRAHGGLGNQMFQYAFLLYLKAHNPEVVLNIHDFTVYNRFRHYELETAFGIKENIKETRCLFIKDKDTIIKRVIRKITKLDYIDANECVESPEITYVPMIKWNKNIYFNGYWQRVEYVNAVKDDVLSVFKFKELDKKNSDFIEDLKQNYKNLVSVHVRRGDYLNLSSFNICDLNYYQEAILYVKEKVEAPIFVFFSDDITWCRKAFCDCNAVYVDWNNGSEAFKDMQLMSMCNHNIIPNSTFSWWGAYLNQTPNKIVISPKKWNQNANNNFYADKDWVQL